MGMGMGTGMGTAQGTEARVHQRRPVAPTSSASPAGAHRAEQGQERLRRLVLFPILALYLCAYLGVLVRPWHPSLTTMLEREEDGLGPGHTSANLSASSSVLAPAGFQEGPMAGDDQITGGAGGEAGSSHKSQSQSLSQSQLQLQSDTAAGRDTKAGTERGDRADTNGGAQAGAEQGTGASAGLTESKGSGQSSRSVGQPGSGLQAVGQPGSGSLVSPGQRCEWEALRRANETYTRHLALRARAFAIAGAHLLSSRRLLLELVLQAPYPCVNEERLGLWGEGGKWLCRRYYGAQQRERAAVVVSVGSRGDTTFERGVRARLLRRTHTFDPFLSRAALASVARARHVLTFHKAGLTGTTDALAARGEYGRARMLTVFQLMREINASYVDIMKIDCEGCELAVVQDLASLPRDRQPLGQVLIELHGITRVAKMVRLVRTMEGLGYRLFHVEDNPYCWKCYEVAFIHEALVDPRLARWEPPARRQLAGAPSPPPLTTEERDHCASVLGAQAQGALAAQRKRRARRLADPLDLRRLKWQGALSRLLIPEYSCPGAQRMGKWGLGGKWVCRWAIESTPAPLRGTGTGTGAGTGNASSAAAGAGVSLVPSGRRGVAIVTVEKRNSSEDVSFERDACLQLNATVHLFDPRLSARLRGEVSNMSRCIALHQEGLSGARKVKYRRERLRRRVVAVGAVPNILGLPYIDVLSTNCGGCEHEVVAELASLYTRTTVPYGQLLIQMHNARDVAAVTSLLSRIQKLGFLMFHVDRIDSVGMVYDVAFVHESRVHVGAGQKAQIESSGKATSSSAQKL